MWSTLFERPVCPEQAENCHRKHRSNAARGALGRPRRDTGRLQGLHIPAFHPPADQPVNRGVPNTAIGGGVGAGADVGDGDGDGDGGGAEADATGVTRSGVLPLPPGVP